MNPLPPFGPIPLPAPPIIFTVLKVAGFSIHIFLVGTVLAAIPVWLIQSGDDSPASVLAGRLPTLLAFGINAGIVPLLAVQVLYPNLFYTAAIMEAWHIIGIVPLLLIAYYLLYFVTTSRGNPRMRISLAVITFILLAVVGLTFSSVITLMTRPDEWLEVGRIARGGAFSGLGFYLSREVAARFLMVLGLGLGAASGMLAVSAGGEEKDASSRRLVPAAATAGLVIFLASASLYIPMIGGTMDSHPILKYLAAAGPFLALALALLHYMKPSFGRAVLLVHGAAVSILLNALAREAVQGAEISVHLDLSRIPVETDPGPILLFAGSLVIGILLIKVIVKEMKDARSRAS